MKKAIHIRMENETIEELNKIANKTKVAKSVIIDMILQDGLEQIKKLNYNFTKFIEEKS